jgi:hypothetical protein
MVKLSTGDATSSLGRPLAAKIGKLTLLPTEKTRLTGEWYTLDLKDVLNTDRKPWLGYRLMMSLSACDITQLVK